MALAGLSVSFLCKQLLKLSLNQTSCTQQCIRNYRAPVKKRWPEWLIRGPRIRHNDEISPENKEFIDEVVKDEMRSVEAKLEETLKESRVLQNDATPAQWRPNMVRTGLIAYKLGDYPMWNKKGRQVRSTLLQILDNQVIKYIPPEEFKPRVNNLKGDRKHYKGCLIVGAQTVDPSTITKEYYGFFKKTGVLPKRNLCRFIISPQAALPSGTPLYASHFRVGDRIDIRGLTISRGFQGVMKRWGFKGQPASHGHTKTHRRPGNIGGGGEKGRVWPGKKMPGHMGNRWRVFRGLHILRINNKHNVIWVKGNSIPGGVNSLCYIYDTVSRRYTKENPPPFPTYFPTGEEPEDVYHEDVHPFSAPSITFSESS